MRGGNFDFNLLSSKHEVSSDDSELGVDWGPCQWGSDDSDIEGMPVKGDTPISPEKFEEENVWEYGCDEGMGNEFENELEG
jgi:hypothetical protein